MRDRDGFAHQSPICVHLQLALDDAVLDEGIVCDEASNDDDDADADVDAIITDWFCDASSELTDDDGNWSPVNDVWLSFVVKALNWSGKSAVDVVQWWPKISGNAFRRPDRPVLKNSLCKSNFSLDEPDAAAAAAPCSIAAASSLRTVI